VAASEAELKGETDTHHGLAAWSRGQPFVLRFVEQLRLAVLRELQVKIIHHFFSL
jgi:hypothetical protein